MRAPGISATTGPLLARPRLLLATTASILAALLVFASGAAAETFAGETTTTIPSESVETPESMEATLVKGSATYDTSGSVSVVLTTAAPPQPLRGKGEPNKVALQAFVAHTAAGGCNPLVLLGQSYPFVTFASNYYEPSFAKGAVDLSSESAEELPATKVVSGDTTTLTISSAAVANLGINCAAMDVSSASGTSAMVFPLKLVPSSPAPAAPSAPAPMPGPAPAPTPAPAKLEITKPKPVELPVGIWRTVKVTVTNPGGSTLSQGTLRVKPAKGVYLKPETQKLPLLTPGDSFTLSVRVELTQKAKKKTTLSLAASGAGAVTGTSSLIVKAAGKG